MARDEDTQDLVKESLRLIVQSEKLLTQLEDHVDMLRTFVHKVDVSETLDVMRGGTGTSCPDDCTEEHEHVRPYRERP